MMIGNRDEVYANLFISGGFWHFNVHLAGNGTPNAAVYTSPWIEGTERKDAITRAKAKIHELRIAHGYENQNRG